MTLIFLLEVFILEPGRCNRNSGQISRTKELAFILENQQFL
jgi:hypothetical protein